MFSSQGVRLNNVSRLRTKDEGPVIALKWNFLVKTVQFLQKSVIDKTKIHKSSLQFNHDKPDFNASSADMGFPVNIISIANDFPTALGRRCVPPAPVQNCA